MTSCASGGRASSSDDTRSITVTGIVLKAFSPLSPEPLWINTEPAAGSWSALMFLAEGRQFSRYGTSAVLMSEHSLVPLEAEGAERRAHETAEPSPPRCPPSSARRRSRGWRQSTCRRRRDSRRLRLCTR